MCESTDHQAVEPWLEAQDLDDWLLWSWDARYSGSLSWSTGLPLWLSQRAMLAKMGYCCWLALFNVLVFLVVSYLVERRLSFLLLLRSWWMSICLSNCRNISMRTCAHHMFTASTCQQCHSICTIAQRKWSLTALPGECTAWSMSLVSISLLCHEACIFSIHKILAQFKGILFHRYLFFLDHFYSTDSILATESPGVFKVLGSDDWKTVNFSRPSCSCRDWLTFNLPCKTLLCCIPAFIIRVEQFTWMVPQPTTAHTRC